MKQLARNAALTGITIAVTFLSLRGAVAIYKQLNPAQATAQDQATQQQCQPSVSSKAQRLQRAQKLIAGMGKDGIVSEVFSAADGTTGVVIKSGTGAFIGWMVEGIDTIFVGAKFDSHGNNVTQSEMIARQLAQPSTTPPGQTTGTPAKETSAGINNARLLTSINQSAGFIEGTSGPIITAYIDPNCSFCTQLWRNLRAPITSGQVRVRWAPVAIIAPDSRAKATTLLQAANPIDLLAEHGQTGKPIPSASESPTANWNIDANNAMLKLLSGNQSPATPTLVVKTAAGDPVITRGLPPNLNELLAQAR